LDQRGVEAFAKLPEQFGFSIEYPDSLSNIRNYYPDFIARTKDGTHWIIETKGREDIEVKRKDATELTGTSWKYIKVPQKEYEALHPTRFEELSSGLAVAE
jgi:type III restriction enzyme